MGSRFGKIPAFCQVALQILIRMVVGFIIINRGVHGPIVGNQSFQPGGMDRSQRRIVWVEVYNVPVSPNGHLAAVLRFTQLLPPRCCSVLFHSPSLFCATNPLCKPGKNINRFHIIFYPKDTTLVTDCQCCVNSRYSEFISPIMVLRNSPCAVYRAYFFSSPSQNSESSDLRKNFGGGPPVGL